MCGASIDDQENPARFADQQPSEKFDEDIGVYPAFFLDHEPHPALRGDRGDQAHGIAGTGGCDDRSHAFLAPGAPRVMIGTDMSRVTKIDVGSLRLGHSPDLRVFRLISPPAYHRVPTPGTAAFAV